MWFSGSSKRKWSSSLITTGIGRSKEHTSELQSLRHLVCRLLLEKKNQLRSHAPIGRSLVGCGWPCACLCRSGVYAYHHHATDDGLCFFLMTRGPPRSPPFPHTTLFR